MSRIQHVQRAAEWIILSFVAAAVLWRGGKSVDATWALAAVAVVVALSAPLASIIGRTEAKKSGARVQTMTVPLALWGLLLLFLLWSFGSYVLSSTRTYGLDELLRDTSCVVLFLWIVRRAGNARVSDLFEGYLRVLTASGAVAVAFGVLVYVVQPVNRFTGTFLDWRFHTDYWPNAWAQFTLLAWPIAVLLATRSSRPAHRHACVAVAGLLIGSLFLSYSRGGFIAFAGQLACIGAAAAYLAVRDQRVAKAVAGNTGMLLRGGATAFFVALVLFGTANAVRSIHYDVQSVSEKVSFTADEGTSSIDERAQFWNQAVELSLERPLFGYGPYSFRFAQPHLMRHVFATSDHPHNVILKLAAERGWPAAALFIAVLVYVIGFSVRHLAFDRKVDWSVSNDVRTVTLLASILGVVAHNMIDYNLQFVGIAFPWWIAFALLSVQLAHKRPVSRASYAHWRMSRSLQRVETVVIALLIVMVSWETPFLFLSSLGRHAEAAGNTRAALTWYERSEPEWFSRDLLLARAQLLEREGLLDEADGLLDQSIGENAIDARAWRMRARLALRRKDPAVAAQYAEHAYRLGRYTDVGILRVLIDATSASGQADTLKSRKQEFDALFVAYADAVVSNTHFIALGGTAEELQGIAELLGRLFPNDAQRYESIAADALKHAEAERATYAARPAGLLW